MAGMGEDLGLSVGERQIQIYLINLGTNLTDPFSRKPLQHRPPPILHHLCHLRDPEQPCDPPHWRSLVAQLSDHSLGLVRALHGLRSVLDPSDNFADAARPI